MKFKAGKGFRTFSYLAIVLAIVILSVGVMSYDSYSYSGTSSSPSSSPTFLSSKEQKFESAVLDKFKEKTFVSVIFHLKDNGILLEAKPEEGKFFDAGDLPAIRNKVKENQDKVLTGISGSDFKLKYKYSVVNALAGEVNLKGLYALNENSLVEKISLERTAYVGLAESVPLINADDAHNIEDFAGMRVTGRGQVICVLDSGIDYRHADLGGCLGESCRVIGGYDFVNNDNDPIDDLGHGTNVAGVLRGVAPDARLLAVKVCDNQGSCSGNNVVAGMNWCIENIGNFGTDVLTMSVANNGQYNRENPCPIGIRPAVRRASGFDIPTLAISGNNGHKNGISWPACEENVISVGAVYDANIGGVGRCLNSACTSTCSDSSTAADVVTCYSNTGSELDFVAPGDLIRTTALGGGYVDVLGTSFAAPHVAGTIALMKQFNPNLHLAGNLVNDGLVSVMRENGVFVVDRGNGLSFPRIDALASLTPDNPPILNEIPNAAIFEGGRVELQLSASDADGDSLVFGTNADEILQSAFTFNSETGAFEWNTLIGDAGSYEVVFSVSDGVLSDEQNVLINVMEVRCGDKVVTEINGEMCDDGNTDDGDGCSSMCQIEFVRGDANTDSYVDISDSVRIVLYLFRGDVELSCMDAADTNDDGAVDVSDAQYLLSFLYEGGPVIPEPYPELGADASADELDCAAYNVVV